MDVFIILVEHFDHIDNCRTSQCTYNLMWIFVFEPGHQCTRVWTTHQHYFGLLIDILDPITLQIADEIVYIFQCVLHCQIFQVLSRPVWKGLWSAIVSMFQCYHQSTKCICQYIHILFMVLYFTMALFSTDVQEYWKIILVLYEFIYYYVFLFKSTVI